MSSNPLNNAEYVAQSAESGTVCPFCGSSHIEGGSFDVEGATASQSVSCNACEAEWVDTYQLTGYIA